MQINWYGNRLYYFWVCSRGRPRPLSCYIHHLFWSNIADGNLIPSAVFPTVKIIEILELLFQSSKTRHCSFSLKILFLGVTEFASCMSLSVTRVIPVHHVRGWLLLFQSTRRQLMMESAMKNVPLNTACIILLFCQINDHWLHHVERSDIDCWIWLAGNIQKTCLKIDNYCNILYYYSLWNCGGKKPSKTGSVVR